MTLRNCIDYHKNAIETRVESIKIELDKLCDSLFLSLDSIEIEVKTELYALENDYNEVMLKNEAILKNLNNKTNLGFLLRIYINVKKT